MSNHVSYIDRLGRGSHVDLNHATLAAVTREAEGMATAIAAREILRQLPTDPRAEQHRAELLKGMGWQCALEDCQQQSRALGLCDAHYRSFRNLPGVPA